jgi:hypothetical protein
VYVYGRQGGLLFIPSLLRSDTGSGDPKKKGQAIGTEMLLAGLTIQFAGLTAK